MHDQEEIVGPQVLLGQGVGAVSLTDYPIRVALNWDSVDDCIVDLELGSILAGELFRNSHGIPGLLLADDRLHGPLLCKLFDRVRLGFSGALHLSTWCSWRPGPPLSTGLFRLLNRHNSDRLGSTASSGSLFWLIHSVFLVILRVPWERPRTNVAVTKNAGPVLCQISQDHVVQLEDLVNVRLITSEIAVKSGVCFHGRLVESLLYLISRHCGMLVEFTGNQKEGVKSGGCAAVLSPLEFHVHPWISMHKRILAHIVLLGVQHLVVVGMAVQPSSIIVESFRQETGTFDAAAKDFRNDLSYPYRRG